MDRSKFEKVVAENKGEFIERMRQGFHVELVIKGAYIMEGNLLTNRGVDNYPILVIERELPPDYLEGSLQEFYIIPMTPVIPGDEDAPPMTEIQKGSIELLLLQLLQTVFNVSPKGLSETP